MVQLTSLISQFRFHHFSFFSSLLAFTLAAASRAYTTSTSTTSKKNSNNLFFIFFQPILQKKKMSKSEFSVFFSKFLIFLLYFPLLFFQDEKWKFVFILIVSEKMKKKVQHTNEHPYRISYCEIQTTTKNQRIKH